MIKCDNFQIEINKLIKNNETIFLGSVTGITPSATGRPGGKP